MKIACCASVQRGFWISPFYLEHSRPHDKLHNTVSRGVLMQIISFERYFVLLKTETIRIKFLSNVPGMFIPVCVTFG